MRDTVIRQRAGKPLRMRDGVIVLHPYTQTAEGWSVGEDELRALYSKMHEEGTFSATWPAYSNPEDWLTYLQDQRNVAVLAKMNGEWVSLAWINGITKNAAFVHHWFSKAVWGGQTVRIASEILHYWFAFKGKDGEPLFQVFIGQTPPSNTMAIRFAAAVGFAFGCAIPHVDGVGVVVSYLTREMFYGRRE
jgi:hypothetical protein